MSDNRRAVGHAWNLTGFMAKMAQGVSCFLAWLIGFPLLIPPFSFSLGCVSDCWVKRRVITDITDFFLQTEAPNRG